MQEKVEVAFEGITRRLVKGFLTFSEAQEGSVACDGGDSKHETK